jgi:hypothetical protein
MPVGDHRDTACPYTKLSKSKRIERYPDFIAIGMPKCGTGTLAFFDCHSKIVFRESEAEFFNSPKLKRWKSGLKSYAIPRAAKDETLIEKTPNYSRGNRKSLRKRANIIKKTIPKSKLLVVLCDPVKRYISHQKHICSSNLGTYYNESYNMTHFYMSHLYQLYPVKRTKAA